MAAPAAIQTVIQALDRGVDLSTQLEAAAAGTGAGGAAGQADGGSTFVQLARLVEPTVPLAYSFSFTASFCSCFRFTRFTFSAKI